MADKRTVDTALVFVYGSLMRGLDLHYYMAGATFIGDGWTLGTLVALGRYPGLVEGATKVVGELYRLADVASLEALDELEEFDPSDPDVSIYVRAMRDVHTADGPVHAWVYLYARDTTMAPVVKSGDWRRYVRDSLT